MGVIKSITFNHGITTACSGGLLVAADITDGTITGAKIGANEVGLSNIQQISTNRLLGRSTAGTGNVEQIIVGSGLSLSAGTLSSTLTYGDEEAQDAVGGILADSSTIDFTYTDATPSITASVITQLSITSDGSGIKLSGDSGSPGNNKVYGTNGSGTKGWYDAGSYTDEQAQDAVGSILVNSDSIQFAYTDGTPSITAVALLSAFGSLESTVNGIRLDGDTASPGNDYIYGTNASGDKGWYPKWVSAPASAGSTGVAGQMAYDSGYLYICYGTNTWFRLQSDAWA